MENIKSVNIKSAGGLNVVISEFEKGQQEEYGINKGLFGMTLADGRIICISEAGDVKYRCPIDRVTIQGEDQEPVALEAERWETQAKMLFNLGRRKPTNTSASLMPEWVRPDDRPEIPILNKDEAYILFGVGEGMPNNFNIRIQTGDVNTNYTVDWGDGRVEEYTRNTVAEHVYDFETLDKPIGSEGYKWVWIKVNKTNNNGRFITFDLQSRTSTQGANVSTDVQIYQAFEIYLKGESITGYGATTTIRFNYYTFLDIFDHQGANSITTLLAFSFNFSINLKVARIDLSSVTSLNTAFGDCYELKGLNNWREPLDCRLMAGTALASFAARAYKWEQQLINLAFLTSCSVMFNNWLVYNKQLNIDTSLITTFVSAFTNMINYSGTLDLDLGGTTTEITTNFNALYKLTGLRLRNMPLIHVNLTIRHTMMNAEALELLMSDLPDRTSHPTGLVNLNGSLGSNEVSDEAKAALSAKNWTLTI